MASSENHFTLFTASDRPYQLSGGNPYMTATPAGKNLLLGLLSGSVTGVAGLATGSFQNSEARSEREREEQETTNAVVRDITNRALEETRRVLENRENTPEEVRLSDAIERSFFSFIPGIEPANTSITWTPQATPPSTNVSSRFGSLISNVRNSRPGQIVETAYNTATNAGSAFMDTKVGTAVTHSFKKGYNITRNLLADPSEITDPAAEVFLNAQIKVSKFFNRLSTVQNPRQTRSIGENHTPLRREEPLNQRAPDLTDHSNASFSEMNFAGETPFFMEEPEIMSHDTSAEVRQSYRATATEICPVTPEEPLFAKDKSDPQINMEKPG